MINNTIHCINCYNIYIYIYIYISQIAFRGALGDRARLVQDDDVEASRGLQGHGALDQAAPIYIYICIYIYTCTYITYMYIYTHIYIHICYIY